MFFAPFVVIGPRTLLFRQQSIVIWLDARRL